MRLTFLILIVSLFYAPNTSLGQRTEFLYSISGKTMGTSYTLKIPSVDVLDVSKLKNEIDAYLVEYSRLLSTWDDKSVLSSINSSKLLEIKIESPLILEVFKLSIDAHKLSEGYFNFSMKPLLDFWRNQSKIEKWPKEEEVLRFKKMIDPTGLIVSGNSLIKPYPLMSFEFSAIAPGHAVDKLAEILIQKKLNNFLLEIGGEIRANGKFNNSSWGVPLFKEISNPTPFLVVQLNNQSLATSGNYLKVKKIDGKHYSHVINPLTLYPTDSSIVSVTVVAKDCYEADYLATTLLSMGKEKAFAFVKSRGIESYFFYRNPSGIIEFSQFPPSRKNL